MSACASVPLVAMVTFHCSRFVSSLPTKSRCELRLVTMAAAVAGAGGTGGGAGGGDRPPWRNVGLPPPPAGDGEDEEEELSKFSRRLCKKCNKVEYLRKGGCANPACVSWQLN